jgi:hypothetical protein
VAFLIYRNPKVHLFGGDWDTINTQTTLVGRQLLIFIVSMWKRNMVTLLGLSGGVHLKTSYLLELE